MAEKKISELDLIGSIDRAADFLEVSDTSAGASKRATPNTILGITGNPVGHSDSQTLTNKTITSPTISGPTFSGTLIGTYTIGGTPTFPSSVVTLTGSQTLTNKVLTSPTINTATISNPTLTVDTVSEHTGANGVTVDGLNIKDGALNTANSVNAAALDGIDRSLLTTDSNPYKFRASRNAAANTGAATFAVIAFDAEQFDTNNNLLLGVYTVPVTAYYFFNWGAHATTTGSQTVIASLFKNGTEYTRGSRLIGTGVVLGSTGSDLVPCTAADTLDIRVYSDTARPLDVGNTTNNYFSGCYVSKT